MSTPTPTKSDIVANMLKQPRTSRLPPLHPFFDNLETTTIRFDGGSVQSILPTLIKKILLALSEPNPCYLRLQQLYLPAISGYRYTVNQAVSQDKLGELIQEVQQHAKKLLSILSFAVTLQKTRVKDEEGAKEGKSYDDSVWAFVPVKDLGHSTTQIDSNTHWKDLPDWDHQMKPTIFFRPTIDLLFANSTTPEEEAHVISYAVVIVCHELAHLFPRFVYLWKGILYPAHIKFPFGSRVTSKEGEGGEGVEIEITGGTSFGISYKIDETLNTLKIYPLHPHGFRISTLYDSMLLVVVDTQIHRFLSSFFVSRIPILRTSTDGMLFLGAAYRKLYNVTPPPLLRHRDMPAPIAAAVAGSTSPPRTPEMSTTPSPSSTPLAPAPVDATHLLGSPFFLASAPALDIGINVKSSDKGFAFPSHLLR
ncbi:hypothetical protein BT96DRAFT_985242 [Gymnopus androsaceus JB14]|uniref:Uncharacterized protein n=1 Tax=Gymnopus androsaceus JB14 TaxID=1447944 RepID=A0A6A4IK55_9AGAR|nr:hypothetical protein BT96DRAFT_985242 [Gymnopus androsaceus JB14]